MGLTWRQQLIPKSRPQRPGDYMNSQWFTVHNTGNPNATAANHANYECNNNLTASYHYVVDDKECVLLIPPNEQAWHAGDGDGPGNTKSVAMEVCEFTDGVRMNNSIKNSQAAITAIISGTAQSGFNAAHLGVEDIVPHQKWTGKYCPRIILGVYGWSRYIKEIEAMEGGTPVADELTYRVVVCWAEDLAARNVLVAKATALMVMYKVDGPLFYAHANINKCKELEAVVAANPKLHRMNSILTPKNTAGFFGVADGIGSRAWVVVDPNAVAAPPSSATWRIVSQDSDDIIMKRV